MSAIPLPDPEETQPVDMRRAIPPYDPEVGEFQHPVVMPSGILMRPGNIDLNNRPVVQNANGTHSSELSFSRGTDEGETLVPQVVHGKMMPTQDAAWQHYVRTGESMGSFSSPEAADAYAEQVHRRPGTVVQKSSRKPMYVYPVNSSPAPERQLDDPIHQWLSRELSY
jgi:hypothetical protein